MSDLPQQPPQSPKSKPSKVTLMKATNLAFEFGFIFALPLVAFGYLGKYLDKKYGTHFIVLIAIILAILSSSFWFYRRISSIVKDLNNSK